MTSPVGSLFSALLRQMSQENETAVFIDDDQRARMLRACFEAYYADIHHEKLVFDTNRMWTTKLPALVELFPGLRMICCVRNPAWVIDSVERLTRRNKFEPSKIFNFDPGGTVYSRADGLSSGSGMLGVADREIVPSLCLCAPAPSRRRHNHADSRRSATGSARQYRYTATARPVARSGLRRQSRQLRRVPGRCRRPPRLRPQSYAWTQAAISLRC